MPIAADRPGILRHRSKATYPGQAVGFAQQQHIAAGSRDELGCQQASEPGHTGQQCRLLIALDSLGYALIDLVGAFAQPESIVGQLSDHCREMLLTGNGGVLLLSCFNSTGGDLGGVARSACAQPGGDPGYTGAANSPGV
ncbi:MAG: hypothetical protein WAW21_00080 [Corynebacterium variabile]|nr:hypothetical protein [Corynebacterium variabile]